MKSKKVMVIGARGQAARYLREIAQLEARGAVVLRAVTVRNRSGLESLTDALTKRGVQLYESAEDMLSGREQVDICFIPTPFHFHQEHIALATSAGANVLVEKPLAASVADSLRIQRSAQRSGKQVWVAFQDMYSDSTWAIKDILVSGQLGRVKSISILACMPRSVGYFSRNKWAGKVHVDNALVHDSPVSNAFSHFMNLALFWAGREQGQWANVRSVAGCLVRAQAIESFDTCSLEFTTSSDVIVRSHLTHSCTRNVIPTILIACEKGQLEWKRELGYRFMSEPESPLFKMDKNGENFTTMIKAAVSGCGGSTLRCCDVINAHEHVRLVDIISNRIDIHRASRSSLMNVITDHGEQVAIRDIEQRFAAAFAIGKLLSRSEICGY
jgi:predicted dehydrogenase